MSPKVSVIIPVYNVEQYLVEAMDSVVNQTLKDLEIICINDGSTDNSLSVLNRYAENDDRIIIVDKENGGYGIGMNIGIDKATGQYIGILEPDDFLPENMFEELYEVASENDLDFVKADFYRFVSNEDGSLEKTYVHLSDNPDDYNKVFDPSFTPKATKYVMNTWSGIYKRDFLNQHHIRHNTTPGASYQDNGFWMQTFMFARRAMIVDKPYYMNRRDNPNSSVYNPNKVYTMNIEYDHIRDIFMQHPDIWERFKGAYWYKKYYSYEASLKRVAEQFKKPYLQRFSREFKRGWQLGEIDSSYFSVKGNNDIKMLIERPEEYYQRYVLKKKPASGNKPAANKKETLYERVKKKVPQPIKNSIKKVLGIKVK